VAEPPKKKAPALPTIVLNGFAKINVRVLIELLKIQNRYFPDMKKKPYQTPTARWVFQCFQGVTLLYIEGKELVVNLKERQQIIIDCLGAEYQQIYS
jgi:hypothetical protein